MDLKIRKNTNPALHAHDYTYHDGTQVRVVMHVDVRQMSRRLELDAEAFQMTGHSEEGHADFVAGDDNGPVRSKVSTHVLALGEGNDWLNAALLRISGHKAMELVNALGLRGDFEEAEPAVDQESPNPT